MHRAAELEEWFQSRPAHEDNEMTGLFEGKNVVLVLMESMDDWLVNETDTPAIYRLMNEGINLPTSTPPISAACALSTPNSAPTPACICPPTGNMPLITAPTTFPKVCPPFPRPGLQYAAFHYNDVTFYNRGVMEPAMGYEAYNCYKNFGMVGDACSRTQGCLKMRR